MQKKKVIAYFFIAAILVAAVLTFYFSNPSFVGFALFEQNTQAAFSEGVYQNTEYDINDSVIILSANQISGTYTSKVFDAGNDSVWTNLTWQGQGNITFEVRSCSDVNCSNTNFISADLANLDLSGQYFQYKVYLFGDDPNVTTSLQSVVIKLEPQQVSSYLTVSISQPVGEKSSASGIPIQFTVNNDSSNISCWYTVENASNNVIVVNNTVITGCNNSAFDLTGDGNYVFTLYVNDSSNVVSNTSQFLINTPAEEEEETEEEIEEETEETLQETEEVGAYLFVSAHEKVTLVPSSSGNYSLPVKNTGGVQVSGCALTGTGDYASWISSEEDSQSLNVGEEKNFSFSLDVPENAVEGSYDIVLSLKCSEFSRTSKFIVDVVKKTIMFDLIQVQRIKANTVRVGYSLEDLSGEDQSVELKFFLYDSNNSEVANATTDHNVSANKTKEFRTDIGINESLEGNLTLAVNYNSEQYSSSVREGISLGPYTGFSIFGGIGTGGIIAIIVVLVSVAAFFIVRRIRKSKTD